MFNLIKVNNYIGDPQWKPTAIWRDMVAPPWIPRSGLPSGFPKYWILPGAVK